MEEETLSIAREDLCLHKLFEEQARRSPRALAVLDTQGELTYEELDRRAGRLAAYLKDVGIQPDEVVGVYMERCADFVVACLAALKAGGAFLPLELAYPASLLGEVIADAKPRIVLTHKHYTERLPREQARLCLDEDWKETLEVGLSGDERAPRPGLDNLVFVSYSSGTTGKPKGIANPHRAAVRSYLWRCGISDYGPGDRVGCNVFFIWEMFRPLLRGGTTCVIPDDVIYDPEALVQFLEEYRITEVLMTPSLLGTVLNAGGPEVGDRLADLRVLWLNGEVVTRTLARRVLSTLPDTRVLNVFSASETHEVAAGDLRDLIENTSATYCPVGHPMDPDRLYILDEDAQPVPDGAAGELYVGGDCLARGYVNRPELTAQRFVDDPFSPEEGARMYRTGDKARLLPGGDLEVLGRVDFMVKVRGYSIELGAVEAAIERHLAVRSCVVVAEGEEGEDKRLVAYLVPSDPAEGEGRYADWSIDPKTGRSPEIRRRLQESLPHYAIPAVFVELEALPLQDTTGKVDRRQLPQPPARVDSSPDMAERTEALSADASRQEKEALLVRLWEDVLRLEEGDVRRNDDFFDVGGHSLAAAQLLSSVDGAFGVRLSMRAFLEHPTVEGMCEEIEARQRREEDGRDVVDRGQPALDLRSEAVLEPGIRPEQSEPGGAVTLQDAGRVFLTGASGFLGAFLVDALLSRTRATIYCLVRPRKGKEHDPMDPIRANLQRYGLWRSEHARRVVPVVGDLGELLLGVPEGDFDALARELDVVIHNGAVVNMVYPYGALEPVNVSGTREVLRLACRHKTKPVHHVSTNGIFAPGTPVCREDVDLDALAEAREDGYGQSKWVAEKLVWQAAERGLPVTVHRPGNISGHSVSGASNPRDFQGALIAESLRLGAAPEVDGWCMEMTPVDFVSHAICHLAGDPEARGQVFHLADPNPVLAGRVFDWLEELGYHLERYPYPDWLEALHDSPQPGTTDEDGVISAVSRGAAPETHELWDGNTYDDSNTRRALRGSGLRRPQIDASLIGNYVSYFVEQGWISASPELSEGHHSQSLERYS